MGFSGPWCMVVAVGLRSVVWRRRRAQVSARGRSVACGGSGRQRVAAAGDSTWRRRAAARGAGGELGRVVAGARSRCEWA
jgi:hypothetical protein